MTRLSQTNKQDNNVLEIHNSEKKEFCVFGDDSAYKKSLAYVAVVFPTSSLSALDSEVRALKSKWGYPTGKPLHFKNLTHPDARRKTGVAHLKDTDVRFIALDCVSILNKYGGLAVASAESFEEMASVDSDEELQFHPNNKSILVLLMKAALLEFDPLKNNFFIEADETKIWHLGKRQIKINNAVNIFSSIGAPRGMVFRIYPEVVGKSFSSAMEIADAMAFIASHAKHPDDVHYAKILNGVSHQKHNRLNLDTDKAKK